MWIIILTALFCAATSTFAQCSDGPLQPDVLYDKIGGEWCQAYYTSDSLYSEASCSESKIFGLNQETQDFYMETTVDQIVAGDHKPIRHVISTTANYGVAPIVGVRHVKDHIASDYDNYFILYQCNNGKSIVSVELRKGINRLPLKKMREVAGILEKVGVDYFSLNERQQIGCNDT